MTSPIIIDLRCLQDTGLLDRGIGNQATCLVTQARAVSPWAASRKLIGLVDADLQPLAGEIAAGFDELRQTSYIPDLPAGTIFLQPAPMSAPPAFVARLLLAPQIKKAAVVYDFIPYDDHETYFPKACDRLDYLNQLVWLGHYDLYLPISAATEGRLHELIPHAARSKIIGSPLTTGIAPRTPRPSPQHILIVAGNDPRKNLDCAIRAYARSTLLQTARIPLVISGNYPADRQQKFKDFVKAGGADDRLIIFTGKISQQTLFGLYQQAFCLVTSSKAEGFSIPVIEAMAAGVPSIVSDIPAHAELVADPSLRFAPDDDDELRRILERIVAEPGFAASIVAAQSPVWPQFTSPRVAERAWTAIAAMAYQPVFSIGGGKPRIAYCSPLPPARSGIADYSAACLAALQPLANVTAFAAGNRSAFPYLSNKFDRVVGVMGNSYLHDGIYENLRRYGGACICHDARLMHFYINREGLDRAAVMAGTELAAPIAGSDITAWLEDETVRKASFLGELAALSTPLILHNAHTAQLVQQRFNKPARHIPFAIIRNWSEAALSRGARQQARQRLGMADGAIHIVSFGFIAAVKGLAAGINLVHGLKALKIIVTLHWLGETSEPLEPWRRLAEDLGVAAQIIFHDRFVTEPIYRDFLLAADYGLQLRLAGPGNISAALQDCISAGLPCLAEKNLADALQAPSYVDTIDTALEGGNIAAVFMNLWEKNLSRQNNEAERAAYCEHHSMANYAQNLLAALDLG